MTAVDASVEGPAPTPRSVAEVEADPVTLNSNLGTYTNFVNLLGLSAPEIADVFTEWNAGDLDSFLVEITAQVLRQMMTYEAELLLPAHGLPVAGKARTVIGEELGLTDKDRFAFAWIVDFPIYQVDEETGGLDFDHNPFSMPQGGMEALNGDPLAVRGFQYDLACNGYELVSGAIRNHKPEIMFKAFELAGYGEDEVRRRFGGMVNAFRFGAPPHGGCAAGIDRMVMLLADETSIREVIMFPMNQRAEDLMMGAPSEPMSEQLMELSLRVVERD